MRLICVIGILAIVVAIPVMAQQGPVIGGPDSLPPFLHPFVGEWLDQPNHINLRIDLDGIWVMQRTVPAPDPMWTRAGNWGMINNKLNMRTVIAHHNQLWIPGIPRNAAEELVSGKYDLTIVWEFTRQGNKLVGTVRNFSATWDRNGKITAFKTHKQNSPVPVSLTRVMRAAPKPNEPNAAGIPTLTSGEMYLILKMLEAMPEETYQGGGGAARKWVEHEAGTPGGNGVK